MGDALEERPINVGSKPVVSTAAAHVRGVSLGAMVARVGVSMTVEHDDQTGYAIGATDHVGKIVAKRLSVNPADNDLLGHDVLLNSIVDEGNEGGWSIQ